VGGMKKLTYPTKLMISLNKTDGETLDKFCSERMQTRPAMILTALRSFFASCRK